MRKPWEAWDEGLERSLSTRSRRHHRKHKLADPEFLDWFNMVPGRYQTPVHAEHAVATEKPIQLLLCGTSLVNRNKEETVRHVDTHACISLMRASQSYCPTHSAISLRLGPASAPLRRRPSLRPPDLRDFDVGSDLGSQPRRRSSRRVSTRCPDR